MLFCDIPKFAVSDFQWEHQQRELHALFRGLADFGGRIPFLRAQGCAEEKESFTIAFGSLLAEALAALIQYNRWEEKLMKTLPRNPHTIALCERHRREHQQVAVRLSKLAGELAEHGLQDAQIHAGSELIDWLFSHIQEHDLPLREMLVETGWTHFSKPARAEHFLSRLVGFQPAALAA